MKKIFSEKFPPYWLVFQTAHCEIALGNYEEALSLLLRDKDLYSAQEKRIVSQYLKEIQSKAKLGEILSLLKW